MRTIWTISWKDIQVLFRDWAAVLLMLGGPLILALGLGLVTGSFGGGDDNGIPEVPVAIVDQDGGELGKALADVYFSEDLKDLVAPELVHDVYTARQKVESGAYAAAVIIPPGFTSSFLPDLATGKMPEKAVPVEIYGDPGRPISAGVIRTIANEFVSQVQTGFMTMQITLGELAASGAVSPVDLPALGEQLGRQLYGSEENTPMATSSLIAIETNTTSGTDDRGFDPMAYIAPAMALLFLMYTVSMGGRSFLVERNERTLPRMLASPATTTQVFGGKVLGIFLSGVLQMTTLILVTSLIFGLRWGSPLGVAVLVLAAVAAATGWGLLLGAVSRTPGQAASLGSALMLIFGILGGSFVSLSNAGPAVDALSKITPNAWALDGFTSLALGEGLSSLVVPITALLVMGAVLFVIAVVVFRRRQSAFITG